MFCRDASKLKRLHVYFNEIFHEAHRTRPHLAAHISAPSAAAKPTTVLEADNILAVENSYLL